MDPRQRPLLTPQATWADKADEKVARHRQQAEAAARQGESSPTRSGVRERLIALLARLRRR